MSVHVFVDGGWIGVESAIDETRQITAITAGDALRLAADLIDAAVGPQASPNIPSQLREWATTLDGAEVTEPGMPNGTEFASVG